MGKKEVGNFNVLATPLQPGYYHFKPSAIIRRKRPIELPVQSNTLDRYTQMSNKYLEADEFRKFAAQMEQTLDVMVQAMRSHQQTLDYLSAQLHLAIMTPPVFEGNLSPPSPNTEREIQELIESTSVVLGDK